MNTVTHIWRFFRAWVRSAWVLPVLAVSAVFALIFVILLRMGLSVEDSRELNFGGSDVAVSLNDYVSLQAGDGSLRTALTDLEAADVGTVTCTNIGTILTPPDSLNLKGTLAFRELSPSCGLERWGYELLEGTQPKHPNEVVATKATGVSLGQTISGVTPAPQKVVGIADHRNALNAQLLIAAPGTWDSWKWPAPTESFPYLSGVATIYLSDANATHVEAFYRSTGALPKYVIEVQDAHLASSPLTERSPYLYIWPSIPLAFVSVLFALLLNNRVGKNRADLLELLGQHKAKAVLVRRSAELLSLVVVTCVGTLVGWILGNLVALASPLYAGQEAGPIPSFADPLARVLLGVALGVLISTALDGLAYVRGRVAQKTSQRSPKGSFKWVRRSVALVSVLGGAQFLFSAPGISPVFAAMLLFTAACILLAPDLLNWVAGKLPHTHPADRWASRRITGNLARSSLGFAVSALAIGPVIALTVLMTSSNSAENTAATLPPINGQAIYQIGQSQDVNNKIREIVAEIAGEDFSEHGEYYPTTTSGDGIVASQEGFGSVSVFDSVEDIEAIMNVTLPAEVKDVLLSGGVLWNEDYSATQLWTAGAAPSKPIEVTSSVSQVLEERWSRESPGIILAKTAKDLGLKVLPRYAVFNGISSDEATQITADLTNAGLDPLMIRTYSEGDTYEISTFQWVLVSLLGVVGVGLLSAVIRASERTLQTQAQLALSLGAPGRWLSSVLAKEVGGILLLGSAAGIGVALLTTLVMMLRVGITFNIPWLYILLYLLGVTVCVTAVVAAGMRRLRA